MISTWQLFYDTKHQHINVGAAKRLKLLTVHVGWISNLQVLAHLLGCFYNQLEDHSRRENHEKDSDLRPTYRNWYSLESCFCF